VIGKAPRGKTCDAILGILEEGKAVMEDYADSPALDAGLVASAQAVEHYEMARYGTLKAWATQLGHKDAVKLLDETLAEETKTDKLLTQLGGPANTAATAPAAKAA
jgi:ferritin-like metal-binding protein YciE